MAQVVRDQTDILVVNLVNWAAGRGASNACICDWRPFGAAAMLIIICKVAQGTASERLVALTEARPGERLMTGVS